MFSTNTSSSSEDGSGKTPSTPFNAITAAAKAQRAREARSQQRTLPKAYTFEPIAPSPAPKPAPRKSRYIQKLVASVESRRQNAEQVAERRILAQQAQTAGPDEEQFVTQAYRLALAERSERERGEREEEERVVAGRDAASVARFSASLFAVGKGDRGGVEIVSGESADATREKGRKRRSRFADLNKEDKGDGVSMEGGNTRVKQKRGLRRNDDKAIEAYRRRYFERVRRRAAGWDDGQSVR